MTSYSKLLPYSCYELGHTWNHNCSQAVLDMFVSSAMHSMKLYGVVYLVTALVSRKKLSKEYLVKILKNYIQSVIFLSINGSMYVGTFCVLKILLGHINYLSASFFPGFLSSFLAINAERQSRRSLLAIYVTNVATECLWNICKSRGYVKPLPRGEVFLFASSMIIFGYYFKSCSNFSPLINSILKLVLGKKESGEYIKHLKERCRGSLDLSLDIHPCSEGRISIPSRSSRSPSENFSNPVCCPHHGSCITNSAMDFIKSFANGFLFQIGLKTLTSIMRIIKRPKTFVNILKRPSNLQFALFLSCFTASFKSVCCLGRKYSGEDKPLHGAFAGGVAGLSMIFYSSPSMAMYALWKAIEAMYEKGIEAGYLPSIPGGIEFLYSLSTAILFHVAVMERPNMKPSYWSFLASLTQGRMGEYNRFVLEIPYGIESGKDQKWPVYSLDHLSPMFKEKFADRF